MHSFSRGRQTETQLTGILNLPNFLAYLPVTSLLTCRQVNRLAKSQIDSVLNGYLDGNKVSSRFNPKLAMSVEQIRNRFKFNNEVDCENFIQKLGHCETTLPHNPFILGSIQIDLSDSSGFSYFHEKLLRFFEIYGKFVIVLEIKFGKGLASQAGVLIGILNSTPNLTKCRVETHPCFFISWPFHYEEIYERIQSIYLPNLNQLDVSRCKTVIGLPDPEYWDNWPKWQQKPKTIEGALCEKFQNNKFISINYAE